MNKNKNKKENDLKKLLLVSLISLLVFGFAITAIAKVNLSYFTHTSIVVEGLQPGEYEQKLIDEFEKLYPEVNIELEVVPYLGDQGKVELSIAAGSPPDIYSCDIPKVKFYVDAGLLLDFDDVIDKSTFYDWAVEASSVNGKMYYYPMGLRAGSFMISREIAKKLGVEDMIPLEGDRIITTSLFEKIVAKSNENVTDETYAVYINFADTVSWSLWFSMFIGSFGGNLFTIEDGKFKCTINSPEAKEGIEYYLGLYKKYPKVTPKGSESIDIYALDSAAKTGKMLTCGGSINQVILERQGTPYCLVDGKAVDWILIPFPTKEGIKPLFAGDWSGYVVFNNHNEEKAKYAKLFVKYFVDNAPNLTGANFNSSPVQKGMPIPKSFDAYVGDPEIEYALKVLPKFAANAIDFGFDSPVISQLKELFVSHMQGVFIGAITVDECLKMVEDKTNKLLDEYYAK